MRWSSHEGGHVTIPGMRWHVMAVPRAFFLRAWCKVWLNPALFKIIKFSRNTTSRGQSVLVDGIFASADKACGAVTYCTVPATTRRLAARPLTPRELPGGVAGGAPQWKSRLGLSPRGPLSVHIGDRYVDNDVDNQSTGAPRIGTRDSP